MPTMPEAEERPTARERVRVVFALAVYAALGFISAMGGPDGVVFAQPRAKSWRPERAGGRPS